MLLLNKMKNQDIFRIGSFLLSGSTVCQVFPVEKNPVPNVILIMTDQQRADLCAREGYALDVMPFVDSLACNNAWFNKAYTTAPASVPARTSMLTGRFPKATHVRTNFNLNDAFFLEDMPSVFRKNGYQTALIGKNHSYQKPVNFDYWSGYGHWGKEKKDQAHSKEFAAFLRNEANAFYLEPSPFDYTSQLPYQIISQSIEWIDQQKDSPFFMWVSIPEPHNPYQVSEPYFSMFAEHHIPEPHASRESIGRKSEKYAILNELETISGVNTPIKINRMRANYLGMIRLIDDQIKRLVNHTCQKGLYGNTIIIFLSDHGDYFGEYGLMKKGAGTPECLTRIPMVWAGYGIQPEESLIQACVSIADVFPTLCSAIGAEIPLGVQGRSLWDMLSGKDYPKKEFESIMVEQGFGGVDFTRQDSLSFEQEGCLDSQKTGKMDELNVWTQSGTQRMLRKGDWKIIIDNYGRGELYNLKKDPSEVENIYNDLRFVQKRSELLADLIGWELRTQDPLPIPQKRYPFKRNYNNYFFEE